MRRSISTTCSNEPQDRVTVTVKQSKEIDELVNGKAAKPQADKQKTETSQKANPQHHEEGQNKKPAPDSVKKQQTPDTAKKAEHSNTEGKNNEETDTPAVDMHKKVMRGSYKVTGYRVQAYAGGNSRNDRLKAERIGNAIKMRYPDQPVYVHFYSPRWTLPRGQLPLSRRGTENACQGKGHGATDKPVW